MVVSGYQNFRGSRAVGATEYPGVGRGRSRPRNLGPSYEVEGFDQVDQQRSTKV